MGQMDFFFSQSKMAIIRAIITQIMGWDCSMMDLCLEYKLTSFNIAAVCSLPAGNGRAWTVRKVNVLLLLKKKC